MSACTTDLSTTKSIMSVAHFYSYAPGSHLADSNYFPKCKLSRKEWTLCMNTGTNFETWKVSNEIALQINPKYYLRNKKVIPDKRNIFYHTLVMSSLLSYGKIFFCSGSDAFLSVIHFWQLTVKLTF